MKKSKKIKIIIIFIILAIILIGIIFNYLGKEKKANIIYGNKECNETMHVSTSDYISLNCKICLKAYNGASSNCGICHECADELGRCYYCGKIKK